MCRACVGKRRLLYPCPFVAPPPSPADSHWCDDKCVPDHSGKPNDRCCHDDICMPGFYCNPGRRCKPIKCKQGGPEGLP